MPTKKLISACIFASLGLIILAWFKSDDFPDRMDLDPGLEEPPRQVPTDRNPFTVNANGNRYNVKPLYDYDFTGLVVSFNQFEPGFGLHERWNDYINVADVCIVWGDNAKELDLNKFEFWNGQFTCNLSTSDREAWERFNPNALANNHLLTEKPRLRAVLDDLQVGDQIRVRGWLSEYGQPDGPTRGTSTTRTDTGNGACETIYLEDVRIISSMSNGWRSVFWLAVAGLIASLVMWFRAPVGTLVRN